MTAASVNTMKKEKNFSAVKKMQKTWFGKQIGVIIVMASIMSVIIAKEAIRSAYTDVREQWQLKSCILYRISLIGEYLTGLCGRMAKRGCINPAVLRKHLTC